MAGAFPQEGCKHLLLRQRGRAGYLSWGFGFGMVWYGTTKCVWEGRDIAAGTLRVITSTKTTHPPSAAPPRSPSRPAQAPPGEAAYGPHVCVVDE